MQYRTWHNNFFAPLYPDCVDHVPNARGEDGLAGRNRRGADVDPEASPEAVAFGRDESSIAFDPAKHGSEHGMRAHTGWLHPDEWRWLDKAEVVRRIEGKFGCTLAEAREVYGRSGGGPTPLRLRPRKARLDAVLADTHEGSLALLARLLDVPERKLQRAAQQARPRAA